MTVNAIPAGVATDVQLSGSTSAFAADSGFLQNNSTTHTLTQENFAHPDPTQPIGFVAHTDNAQLNYVQQSGGVVSNVGNPQLTPFIKNQAIDQLYQWNQSAIVNTTNLFYLSGMDNTSTQGTIGGNYDAEVINMIEWTPGQGGGNTDMNDHKYPVGDLVADTKDLQYRGTSRGEDEGGEWIRWFGAPTNDIAGGTVTLLSLDAQGNQPIQTTASGGYSFNYYEHGFVMDTTAKWTASGCTPACSILNIQVTPGGQPFKRYTFDSASNVSSHWGASTQTTLTQAINSAVYTGACGSQTATGQTYPITGISTGTNQAAFVNVG